uniref:ZAD domain-containing protein n=1 Tax=Anopheles coluzzii TaxID=1518534 RepID=A0A6E8VR20_ANOCL
MEEKCRLCLKEVKQKCITVLPQDEFREMMDAVFCFPIVYKEELPKYVCTECSITVRKFYNYTLEVQNTQSYLERKCNVASKSSITITKLEPIGNCDEENDCNDADMEEYLDEESSTDESWKLSSSCTTDDPPYVDDSRVQLPAQHIKNIESKNTPEESDTTTNFFTKRLRSRDIKCATDSPSLSHPDLPYICVDCDLKLATKAQLTKHRRVHQKKECPVCRRLLRVDKIKDHCARMHPHYKLLVASREIRCDNCLELFDTEAQLHDHLNHDRMQRLALPDARQNEMEDSDEAGSTAKVKTKHIFHCPKRYKCCNCEEKFLDKVQLAKHQRLHRTVDCPICGKTCRTDRIKPHIAKHRPNSDGPHKKLYHCTECKKKFANELQLTLHYRRMHKQLICPVCKVRASFAHVENHLKLLKVEECSDDSNDFPNNLSEVDVTVTENK